MRTKQNPATDTRTRDEKLLDLMAYQRAQDRGLLHMLGDGDGDAPPRVVFSRLLEDRNAEIEPEPAALLSPVQRVVASTDTQTLRRIVKALEADIIQAAEDTNGKGTQAHIGMLEMLEAAGAELDRRNRFNEPGPAPAVAVSVPWVHVDKETGPGGEIRLPGGIRVF